MNGFLFTDVHTISVIKTTETYENIKIGLQCSFSEINQLIQDSQIIVAGQMYYLNFFVL